MLNQNASLPQPPARTPDDCLSFQQVQQEEQEALGGGNRQRSALCISGGGIRSATFALGALQGLAELGILEHFDYLSTVSGGGYIGGWLTAWKHRWKGLTEPQIPGNAKTTVISKLQPSAPPLALESGKILDPVQYLREYNNYLSPKLGFFSADTWTLVATVARNMILNWLIFIPLLMCALALPRIVLAVARLGETVDLWYLPSVRKWFDYLHLIVPVLGASFFVIGVVNLLRYLPGMGGRNHTQGQFLKYCFGPVFLAALALLTTDAWFTGCGKDYATTLSFWELYFWIAIPGTAGYLAYAVFFWKDVARKFRELDEKKKTRSWPKLKWIFCMFLAGVLTSFSTAGGAWLLVDRLLGHLSWPLYVTVAMPLLLISFALAVTVFVGFTSLVFDDDDREWLARAGAWGLLCIVSWTGFSALSLLAPQVLVHPVKAFTWLDSAFAAVGGVSGLVACLAGFRGKAQAGKNGTSEAKSGALLEIAGKIAAPAFIVVFLTSLAILTNWILFVAKMVDGNWRDHHLFLEETRIEDAVLFAAICLVFSAIMAWFININKFSLQAMYRIRLIRAYLGASNDKPEGNGFTGFGQSDNIPLKDLDPSQKPFHVVNMALNLVAGKRLAWQQRKATSFTASPLHCGSDDLCYRRAPSYGGEQGVSLGTAVAISGAAASPNMGYHSAPALTFIMTLFNARLGSWLGNPKQWRWRDEGPRFAFDSIIREAFGLTNDTSPYVYLSDGGHFENLALYEMVRRRCRYIIVLDAAADPDYKYEDLGNALRKIRIDMKIPIQFVEPLPLPGSKPRQRCAVANILYKEIDPSLENGHLIYIKPAILQIEPPDVTQYKAAHDAFPHESTADQWFNESQTESYRMLGLCSVRDIFIPWADALQFEGVVQNARDYLNHPTQKHLAAKAAEAARQ